MKAPALAPEAVTESKTIPGAKPSILSAFAFGGSQSSIEELKTPANASDGKRTEIPAANNTVLDGFAFSASQVLQK